MKTRFKTAEEFIKYMNDCRPFVELLCRASQRDHTPKGEVMRKEAEQLRKALEPDFLRSRFKPNRPDGSMEIQFTEDALALLEKKLPGMN